MPFNGQVRVHNNNFFLRKETQQMITKMFQATVGLAALMVLAPCLTAAPQSSIQHKVMLACRTETMRNDAGIEYVKVFVTNNTKKPISKGKKINILVNSETRGSFSLNFALTPGTTASYQTRLTGKVSGPAQVWIIDDGE
jgi:hypothetical protein